MTKLKECSTLINVEGEVYRLSNKDYKYFKDNLHNAFNKSDTRYNTDADDSWSDLLHWVREHGKHICNVESYNF